MMPFVSLTNVNLTSFLHFVQMASTREMITGIIISWVDITNFSSINEHVIGLVSRRLDYPFIINKKSIRDFTCWIECYRTVHLQI